ncbi:nicotine N-demethylase CYP82E3 [Henckelia pumila]|uniref:nicotine N-demethylase CYP82E3 n=1 Tax=Henckelia pumila TaxID=405737 RepID=UPI003C6DC892
MLICKMNFLSTLLIVSAGLLALLLLYNLRKASKRGNLPPQAAGAWPVIGHLHLLGGQIPVYKVLAALAEKYGPIFTIRLGMYPALVISNWEAVKDCFTNNDKVLANRPNSNAGKYLGYNNAAFGFIDAGPYWREIRKLVVIEVLSHRRLEALKHVQVSELHTSINELYESVQENPGKMVIMSDWIEQLTLNIIVMMIAGKRYAESSKDSAESRKARSFRKVIKEFMCISGQFVVSEAIPVRPLEWVDFQGHIKSMKRVSKEVGNIIESWIQEHMEGTPGNLEQDFIHVMLAKIDDRYTSYGHTRETIIKATVMNLILAGSDTTSIHLTWLLSILLNNTAIMRRAQEEIDQKVGKERWVDESDITNLVYLQAIVKETLRLYPPGPMSVPHEAMEDCVVNGYLIPKGTRLLVNLWKLHRDPRIWDEPDEFKPERFLTSHAEVDYAGQHFEFVPFGSGRRSCPGITFAMQVTHLTLARLLQGFDFATPENVPVDMTEGQGITMPKATPLEVVVAPRLHGLFCKN